MALLAPPLDISWAGCDDAGGDVGGSAGGGFDGFDGSGVGGTAGHARDVAALLHAARRGDARLKLLAVACVALLAPPLDISWAGCDDAGGDVGCSAGGGFGDNHVRGAVSCEPA